MITKQTQFRRDLPDSLSDLVDLAYDLRWNNCTAARTIWWHLDPTVWQRTENPLLVLRSAKQERFDSLTNEGTAQRALESWRREVSAYYNREPAFAKRDNSQALQRVAYFSMEFGLGESLPIYSGGLGMLAGDHLKTASDLGVPLVAVGLLYQQGYFRQVIGADGEQLEAYPFNDPGSLPIRPVADEDGRWRRVELPLPGRLLSLKVWEARVGRVRLYLLDSNDEMNTAWDRGITAQLYDAGRDKRLLQELVLGVGGWYLIEQFGIDVDVCHLNEGHAAFAVFARAAGFASKHGLPLRVAFTATRAGNLFTTHTPVEAAFDCFDPNLLAKYAQPFLDNVGLDFETLLRLGRRNPSDQTEPFNMAWLAMRGCGQVNAVSELHGAVSRDLFGMMFPRWPRTQVPVRAITNGVHVPTWASQRASKIWSDDSDCPLWLDALDQVADPVRKRSPQELWTFRTEQRHALLRYVEDRYLMQLKQQGREVPAPGSLLDPNVLTIGFARRFATYKRAGLLLSDPDRLKRILLNQQHPVQLLVAGKAHPNDGYGKAFVQQMNQFFADPSLGHRAIFLEDYDMLLGQHLVAGVDVWLNTPLRPNEACGTSGMKVLVNGGLNVSVLDGWWDEAVDPNSPDNQPGWIVGTRQSGSVDEVNRRDAASLYELLEQKVIPEFYDRDQDGIPHRWVERVKKSMTELTPQFSATRMMHQYIDQAYLPAACQFANRSADDAKVASDILRWSDQINAHWNHVRVGQVRHWEDEQYQHVSAECWLDDLTPDAIRVEMYAESSTADTPSTVEMECTRELPGSVNGFLFSVKINHDRPLSDFTVRVIPYHPLANVPIENQRIVWQS
ncbi:MAG: alpha-glucan family phosphorylase [Pirellulaceae bacterium]|nr:alpha-glucan family phosphorylase [Pirellulaceae bacterium]